MLRRTGCYYVMLCVSALSCVILRGLRTTARYCVELRGAAWCCVVLRGAAWCCVVLRGDAW